MRLAYIFNDDKITNKTTHLHSPNTDMKAASTILFLAGLVCVKDIVCLYKCRFLAKTRAKILIFSDSQRSICSRYMQTVIINMSIDYLH